MQSGLTWAAETKLLPFASTPTLEAGLRWLFTPGCIRRNQGLPPRSRIVGSVTRRPSLYREGPQTGWTIFLSKSSRPVQPSTESQGMLDVIQPQRPNKQRPIRWISSSAARVSVWRAEPRISTARSYSRRSREVNRKVRRITNNSNDIVVIRVMNLAPGSGFAIFSVRPLGGLRLGTK